MESGKTKVFYCYFPETKEYIGESVAKEIYGEFPKPFASTDIRPDLENLNKNETYVFNETINKWEKVSDYRNTKFYHKETKEELEIKNIGEDLSTYPEYTNQSPIDFLKNYSYPQSITQYNPNPENILPKNFDSLKECFIFNESSNSWDIALYKLNKVFSERKKFNAFLKLREIENRFLSKYTQAEIISWSYKSDEALRIINAQEPLSDILQNLFPLIYNEMKLKLGSEPSLIDLKNRAAVILNNKRNYEIMAGKIAGLRSRIYNMTDEEIIKTDLINIIEIEFQ